MHRFKCPSCNRSLKVKDDSTGKRMKCPSCGGPITIPERGAPPSPFLPTRREWLIQTDGQEWGPYTAAELQGKAKAGQIGPETPIRRGGRTWSKAGGFYFLADYFSADPAPKRTQTESSRPEITEHPAFPLVEKTAFSEPVSASPKASREMTLVPAAIPPADDNAEPSNALFSGPQLVGILGAFAFVLLTGAILIFVALPKRDGPARAMQKPSTSAIAVAARVSKPDSAPPEIRVTTPLDPNQSLSAEALFRKASPAVVRIEVQPSPGSERGQGSGFLVTKDGLVATNHHVIRGGSSARVFFGDESSYPVEGVAAVDSESDLALLKIRGDSFPVLELAGSSLPAVGSKVFAIGSPGGLTNSLSEGLVSGHRSIGKSRMAFIQTTAPISPGSSGGPLLGTDGKVVGVTTGGLSGDAQNLNLAVPVEKLNNLLRARGPLQRLPLPGSSKPPREITGAEEESTILALTNLTRTRQGFPPLRLNATLAKVARTHSANMAKQEKMEHELDGKNPSQRIKEAGYAASWGGENIAESNGDTPELIFQMWMDSPPHKANILKKEFTEIGVGVARNANGGVYYTQLFATPANGR